MANMDLWMVESSHSAAKCIDQYAKLPPYVGAFLSKEINALEPDGKTFLYGYFDPTGVTLENVIRTDLSKSKSPFKPKPKPHGSDCKCLTCLIVMLENGRDCFKSGFPPEKIIDEHLTFYRREPGWYSRDPLWEVLPFIIKVAWYCSTDPIDERPTTENDGYEHCLQLNLAKKYGHTFSLLANRVRDQTKLPTTLVVIWSKDEMPVSQLISPDIQPGVLDLSVRTLSLKSGFHLRTRKDMEEVPK